MAPEEFPQKCKHIYSDLHMHVYAHTCARIPSVPLGLVLSPALNRTIPIKRSGMKYFFISFLHFLVLKVSFHKVIMIVGDKFFFGFSIFYMAKIKLGNYFFK